MAMTKEDYEEQGRQAFGTISPWDKTCNLTPGSWQHRHFMIGFKQMEEEAGFSRNVEPTPAHVRLPGVFEHLRLLKAEINSSKINPAKRHFRIAAKIKALEQRHGLL